MRIENYFFKEKQKKNFPHSPFSIKHLLLFLLLVQNAQAFVNPGGYWGYSFTPTPTSMEIGEVGYVARFGYLGKTGFSHGVAMRPLSFLELGVGIKREPIPALKLMYNEHIALGFSGKKVYFTGQQDFFTISGIYDTDLKYSIGSLAYELNLNYASFVLENFFYQNRYGAMATFTLRPFAAFSVPSFIEASAGIGWRSPEHSEDDFYGYVSVLAKAPLIQTEKEPLVYLDINPSFDHSVSFTRDIYTTRLSADIDAVLTTPYNIFLVGGFSPSIKLDEQERMPERDLVDRYYLLWDSEANRIWAACGMLNTDIYGCQAQAHKNLYNTFALTLGYTEGDQSGANAILEVPMHPQLSGALARSLIFAEGGWFLGANPAVQLNFRQGTEKKFLQFGSGYDFNRKSIFGELSLQYAFSVSKQISSVQIRLAPNLRHRENSDFYVFDYDVPIYQEGNNARRLHNFPWRK